MCPSFIEKFGLKGTKYEAELKKKCLLYQNTSNTKYVIHDSGKSQLAPVFCRIRSNMASHYLKKKKGLF